jgi:ABC-type Mn2+/Zn2+ transport system permease subunit
MFSSAFQFIAEYPAAQRALIAGLAVAAACSLLSVFVVLKRMAFIGQGISHAGYGAAGTALFLGLVSSDGRYDVLVLAFCIATAWLIGFIARRRRLNEDTAIGILLAGTVAWGVFITNLSAAFQKPGGPIYWPWYARNIGTGTATGDFDAILFGALLNITPAQAIVSVVTALLVIAVLWAFFKEIVFFAFDEPTSQVYGVRTAMIHYLLLTLLAVTVVLTMRLAGVLLVGAILVIPGATALMLSDRLSRVLLISFMTGVIGVALGLLVSLELGFSGPGPCIVGVLCVMFVLASGWRGLAMRRPGAL